MPLKTLHCENDQTKTSSFSHDWHVQPDCQRSITGVRLSGPFWIKEYTAKLCVLELVALHFAGCLPTLAIYAHLPKLQSFRELVNGYFFHLLKRACSTKFERSAQKAAPQRMRSGGQFCPRGEIHPRRAMDCSLWKDFPSLPPVAALHAAELEAG
jgi:hypothetical protein